jgi:hypothetical protein
LSIIGYIIIKSTAAIGSETFANWSFVMKVDNEGKKYPSNVPATIQTPTHNERYLLKKSKFPFSLLVAGVVFGFSF